MGALVVALSAVIAIGLYAESATSGTNTIEIVPLGGAVPLGGVGGGGFGQVDPDDPNGGGLDLSASVEITEIDAKFVSHPDADNKILGQMLSQVDLPDGIESGNLVIEVIWSNSIDAGGVLKKPNEFLNVGLYFLDSDQREASDDGDYSGDCTEGTQRRYEIDGIGWWICPDDNPTASTTLTVESAYGILSSTVDAHSQFFVLGYIPRIGTGNGDKTGNGKGNGNGPPDDDDDEVGSVNPGQIKQMEFVYTVLSVS